MAEFNSRQAAKVAAGTKLTAAENGGVVRCISITSPATAAWAQNDTLASGVPIPIGSRFLCISYVSNAAMGTSVTLDVGIRNFETKAVIDADGIVGSLAIASAGRTGMNNGVLIKDGAEYVTTEVCEVYATLTGADPTDNAQFRLDILYVAPS